MLQLEHGLKIDNKEYIIVLSDDDADKLISNISKYDKLKAIYMSSDVLLSSKQKKALYKCFLLLNFIYFLFYLLSI